MPCTRKLKRLSSPPVWFSGRRFLHDTTYKSHVMSHNETARDDGYHQFQWLTYQQYTRQSDGQCDFANFCVTILLTQCWNQLQFCWKSHRTFIKKFKTKFTTGKAKYSEYKNEDNGTILSGRRRERDETRRYKQAETLQKVLNKLITII